MSGYSINAGVKCYEDRLYVGDAADPNGIAGFDGPFDDNATYVQTDTGSKSGAVVSLWKWEADGTPPCWVGPLEADTDGALLPVARSGDVWTITHEEDGVQTTAVLDLSEYKDDDDVTSAVIAAGPNDNPIAGPRTMQLTLDGEDAPVVSNEFTLPSAPAPEMWDIP